MKTYSGFVRKSLVVGVMAGMAAIPALAQNGSSATAGHDQASPPATQPEAIELDAIVVVGYAAQNQQMITEKREYEGIGEFLTSDDLGQQVDYNIADSLRRLPGVQTEFDNDEGKFISIRGLNPSYTLGSFDGATMASAERNNRQLNAEVIPSSMVGGAEVIMTRTPDVDGNAIGGTYNLRSRSAFDSGGKFYARGNLFVGMSDSTSVPGRNHTRNSDDGMNFRFDGTTSFTFGENDAWGLLLSASYRRTRRDEERLAAASGDGNDFINTEPAPRPANNSQFVYHAYPYTMDRRGVTAKLEYYPNETFRAGMTYSDFKQEHNSIRMSQRLRGSGANFVRLNHFPLEKPLNIGMANFRWQPDWDHVITGQASYSSARFFEPSPQLQFRQTGRQDFDVHLGEDNIPYPTNINEKFSDPLLYGFQNFAPYIDESDDYVSEARLDWAFNRDNEPGWGFQAGVKWRRNIRDMNSTQTTYNAYHGPGGTEGLTLDRFLLDNHDYASRFGSFEQLLIDYRKWDEFFQENGHLFSKNMSATLQGTLGGDYRIQEDVAALYALGEWRNANQKLIFGGRWETTDTDAAGMSFSGDGASLEDYYPETRSSSYSNFLPSVTYSWDVSEQLKLRLAYFEGVGRPNLSDLRSNERITEDEEGGIMISRGNPGLKPREGKSYDAALEWYLPDDSGMFSFGVFHKDIANEIFNLRSYENIDGAEYVLTQPINASDASITGLGIAYTLNKMTFLPGFLSDFGFSLNYSYLDGKSQFISEDGTVRDLDFLDRMAKQTANAQLFYERDAFRARISYGYVDDRPRVGASAADDTWVKANHSVNLQARYRLSDRLVMIGEVRNVLDDERIIYRNKEVEGRNYELPTNVNYFGRQFWLGLSFRY